MEESPQINSFIIRFVHPAPGQGAPSYRGTIRHILSNQTLQFTEWADAEDFIRLFVPLDKKALNGDPHSGQPRVKPT